MPKPNTIHSTTQEFLDIHDIVNDLLILKDGSAALILAVDAVNFGLLAEAEQDAIIYSYAGLLNSLNYPIQVLIVSKTKDVSNYLRSLEEQENNSLNEIKKRQIREYRQFVSELIQERNVLDKKFYVVIPASSLELGLLSAQSVIPGVKPKAVAEFDKSVVLDKAMTNLYPKRDHLVAQFARIGLYARQLSTQEIIQLFYVSYNPEAAEGQEITDANSYTSALVQTMQKGENMVNATTPNNPNNGATSPVNPLGTNQATAPASSPSPAPAMGQAPSPTPTTGAMPTTPAPTAPPTPATSPEPAAMPKPTPAPMGAAAPTTPMAPAADAKDAQGDINNNVQALGGAGNTSPAAAPVAPTTTPTPPTPATGKDNPAPLPEI